MTISQILQYKESIKLVIHKKNEHYFTFDIDGIPHKFNEKCLNYVSDYHAHLWITDEEYQRKTRQYILDNFIL